MSETKTQLERKFEREYSEIAGDTITCESVSGCMYGFGTEQAINKLKEAKGAGRSGYSPMMEMWYYTEM